jgi:hypothetical protein
LHETLKLCNPSGLTKDPEVAARAAGVPATLFRAVFNQPVSHQALTTVWSKLVLITAGLDASFGLKVYTQTTGTAGFVNKYFPLSRMVRGSPRVSPFSIGGWRIAFGRCSQADGAILRDGYGDAIIRKGEIHISFERLNDPLGPKTLIHEAAHRFANMVDHSYMDQPQGGRAYEVVFRRQGGISAQEALMNADSYAWLAFLAPGASESLSVYDGISGLFH